MKKLIVFLVLMLPAYTLLAQDTISNKINELITAYQKLGKFNGVALVSSQDKILIEKGYGYSNAEKQTPNDPQTIFQIRES
jgi:CubicO group peptidase (beta-lactamase class C family)